MSLLPFSIDSLKIDLSGDLIILNFGNSAQKWQISNSFLCLMSQSMRGKYSSEVKMPVIGSFLRI